MSHTSINAIFTKKFLTTLTVVGALALGSPTIIHAQAKNSPSQVQKQPGYFHLKIGSATVTALSDGTLPLDANVMLSETKTGEIKELLEKSFLKSPTDIPVNAYLIKIGQRVILVDVGSGSFRGPTLGKAVDRLASVGVKPEQVTDILITHIHPDHTGGLIDGSKKVFPKATLHVDKREIEFWTDKSNADKAPEGAKSFFRDAVQSISPYIISKQVKTFDGETQIFPGLTTKPAYGHTPGQAFFVLENGGETIEFWGDELIIPSVQLENPSITSAFDNDPELAEKSRKSALSASIKDKHFVALSHMTFPGIGHIRQEGDHYGWVHVPYIDDAVKK